MEKEELKRYNRQMILPELGLEGQEKLKSAKVLMVGAGGLGCPVLQYLVAAGVGEIGIIDDDVVDETNLHRQVLFYHEDIGLKKAEVAAQKLRKLNPFITIESFAERLSAENANEMFMNYDLIIDGSDNFQTRYLVNDTCVALGKALVFGSIFKFEGQVSVFNYKNGAQYRDIFPEPPPKDEVPNCAEI
ncbi:MAG TPA: HesA/MoeB/ThiF family protein, partial [Arachidicoccus soli]|nr:HesA/MoeB/ThiF family protein [Arachidicoccus soli]